MRTLFSALLALGTSIAFAQEQQGKVFDIQSQQPLSGATIRMQGSKARTSDKNGSFNFNCGTAKSLTVSFVGYETITVTIKDCNTPLAIGMTPRSQQLDEVEISAISNQNRQLLYQPVSLTKLSETELKRSVGLYLDDAINTNVPGVTMNRRTVSAGQQFNIRGYGNGARGTRGISSNFDGQGYKVYLNGIPLTDAEGITVMDDIDFSSIGNVEVTKGPAGTLYGLAIAGAVNLNTIKPGKGSSLSQELMFGNYGLRRYTTQFQSGSDRSSILLNYGNQQSDGYSIHNKSSKDFVNFAGNFQPNEKQSINAFVGYANSYDERFGELTIDQWNNGDYSGNPEYIKRDAHSNVITIRAGIGHTYQFSKQFSNTTSIYGTGLNSNASSAGGWTDKTSINYGLRSTFNTRFALNSGTSLNGITGVEAQRQDAQVIGYNMKQDPNDTGNNWVYGQSPYWVINATTSNVSTISKTSTVFTEWTLALPKDLSITGGISLSQMDLELNDRFNAALPTRPTRYQRNYSGMLSPHLAINKVINKNVSLYASYSKGYKAPVSSYFYITTPAVTNPATPPTGRVNEDLKPEIGNQFEIGSKGQLVDKRLQYEFSLFHAVFADKMTAVAVQSPASPNTTLYSYMVNGGKQIHKGLEASVHYMVWQSKEQFVRSIRPFANLTFSDFKYGDGFTIQKSVSVKEDYSNKEVAAVARVVANLGVDLQFGHGIYANLVYNYRDRMPITSLNDFYASSYNLLNGKIGIQQMLGRHFNVHAYAGISNMTNTRYYIMVFANQLPDAYVPAARNALVFGGVNLAYHF
ncbi:TonB-dependent receptor [Flavihumibacter rivuli]|uniref:TonB-dependent receptor n=1 Tax=Flavihumibacter rivuli TaxID=2838156 RepID=UPI001BDE9C0F|nr:TonB-dependent receptor [Flavihumibacter rivuli]ULQ55942.1 TonB-dependent receptor [Flavihumibacter rivuli]